MTTPVYKKHAEYILAIANSYFNSRPEFGFPFEGVNLFPRDQWLLEAQTHLAIRERDWLDNSGPQKQGDTDYRQLLPYTIAYKTINGVRRYITYRRLKKVGEERLAGNASIGFGGHIDLADIVFEKSVIKLGLTIQLASEREIDEELLVTNSEGAAVHMGPFVQPSDAFILDDTNAVGKLHVGLVQTVEIPSNYRVQIAEHERDQLAMIEETYTAEELLASGLPLENWTRQYLEHVVRHTQLVYETANFVA